MQGDSSQNGQAATQAAAESNKAGQSLPGRQLTLYRLLSRLPGPGNFALRIFLYSFVFTQLPILFLLLKLMTGTPVQAGIMFWFTVVLIITLLGSALTVVALLAYTETLHVIADVVQQFANSGREPQLPIGNADAIGELMKRTDAGLKKLHSTMRSMHEISIRDELTCLYNRRFFSEHAGILLQGAQRYQEPLTLIFIDIDNFKSINDRFSHQTGDQVLRELATVMTDTARGSDLIARLGGDEFVILLPNTALDKAEQISRRLCNSIEQFDWSALLPGTTITVSIGMAATEEDDNLEKLIDRADRNLFRAKQAGRNQIRT